jgi:hypothetical protein
VLVAVLLLIALATVLIVTTSGVSQIERKAVSNSAKNEIAKQNALFALQIALGQLQSAAGPDQRVTATADILNSNSVTPSPVLQSYWTGVWKTYNPTYASSPSFRPEPLDLDTTGAVGTTTTALRPWSTAPNNVTWLVSGATNNALINPLTTSSNNWISNSVLLASNWGTNQMSIIVPAVPLRSSSNYTGRYAYWVSDEGVKAKVSISDTNMTNGAVSSPGIIVSSLMHAMGTAVPNVSTVMTNFGISSGLTTDFRSSTNLPKITGLAALGLITNGVPVLTNNSLAGDLTVYSYGVLSDTRNGGLRQDLTAAFESTGTGNTNYALLYARSGTGSGNDSVCAYRAQNLAIPAITATIAAASTTGGAVTGTAVYDGARWQSLYSFYNLYKAIMPLSPPTTAASSGAVLQKGIGVLNTSGSPPTLNARVPFYMEPATGGSNIISYLAPALIADRLDCAITPVTTNNKIGATNVTSYTFAVNYYPMLVMMNPYPVSLDVSKTMYSLNKAPNNPTVTLTCFTNKITSGWTAFTYTTNPVTGVVTTNSNNVPATSLSNLWPFVTNGSGNTVSSPAQTWGENGIYPFTMVSATNLTIMAPGEIRVLALSAATNATNMAAAVTISGLTPSGASLGYASIMVQTNWTNKVTIGTNTGVLIGTTNSTDPVSVTLSSYTAGGYGEVRWNIGFGNSSMGFSNNVSGWPATVNPTGYGSALLGAVTASPAFTITPVAGSYTISGLPSAGLRILGMIERLKGSVAVTDPNYAFSSTNLPLFCGNCVSLNGAFPAFAGLGSSYPAATETYAKAGGSAAVSASLFQTTLGTTGLLTTSWGSGSVGSSVPDTTTSKANNTSFVFYDIPIAPMTSLGQFMHLSDKVFNSAYAVDYLPRMSVGGSYATPDIPLNKTAILAGLSGSASTATTLRDNSYMANEALFDTYFFSTVPPASGFNWASSGTLNYGSFAKTITSATIAQRQALPNFRYTFYFKNGTNAPAVTDLQNESKAAANLLVDGAFNVNSTSVAAWKALLTSLAGQSFLQYNYLTGKYVQRNPSIPILRFWSVCRSSANDPWDGMRDLTDAQVTVLAQEIVKQVRLRGPFLSMGDFLNRRLGSTATQLTTMGALQAAIENTQNAGTTSDVNSNIHTAGVGAAVTTGVIVSSATGATSVANIITNSATGIPGYLMQQDLVQAFAPVMTPRSDTFVIRVYGEADKSAANVISTNYASLPSGVTAQAWGEAVVQRLPDYFDQTDSALTANASTYGLTGITMPLGDATPSKNVNTLNQTFGRRFKIVSFRWINQNEL